MTIKKNNHQLYCFPKRILTKLAEIPEHFLTVVEAPSGFGKTTAVREYFTSARRKGIHEKWYTCLGESPEKAWAGICALFDDIAEDLLELELPTQETLPNIVALLERYNCPEKTYCIIDNYQMFTTSVQRRFITALSSCKNENLHIVIVTQPLKDDPAITYPGIPYHTINAKDFFFDTPSIAKYCQLTGIKISPEDIANVQAVSEGWIAAIRLQLKNYNETGTLMDAGAIGSLIQKAVWNKLSDWEKTFLLAVSLLDGFTAYQAAIMSGSEQEKDANVPEILSRLLAMDFFVRYVADKKVYSIHSILRDYLLDRFAMQPESVIESMRRKAASACVAVGDYFQAARFFMQVRDYNAVLSLPFSTQYVYNNKEKDLLGVFKDLVDECPVETMQKHPIMLVLIGYLFFRNGSRPHFLKTVTILRDLLETPGALTGYELAQAQAEFYMLMSFPEYNDIAAMSAYHRKAYTRLKTLSNTPRSVVFRGTMPWSLGVPGIMPLYWSKSGALQETLATMDECLPIYSELASGHGAGAESVFRAEAELASGHDSVAESLCYKALYRAQSFQQVAVCLCAEKTLAEIAIMRGDVSSYAAMRDNIARTADRAMQRSVFRMGEIALAVLDLNLGITRNLPDWLRTCEGMQKILYAPAAPYGYMIYGNILLLENRHAELYGLCDHALPVARAMNYVLPQVYLLTYLAIASIREGHHQEAIANLNEALHLALPDAIYLPFAKFQAELRPLLKEVQTGHEHKAEEIARLHTFAARYAQGIQSIRKSLGDKEKSPLTPREKEVAKLAKDRLSANEIASQLSISVNTVNTILKNIYRKLGINSKSALRDKAL